MLGYNLVSAFILAVSFAIAPFIVPLFFAGWFLVWIFSRRTADSAEDEKSVDLGADDVDEDGITYPDIRVYILFYGVIFRIFAGALAALILTLEYFGL